MRVLCVLNPQAASGHALQLWPQIAEWLDAFGLEHVRLSLAGPPAAVEDQVCAWLASAGGLPDAVAGIGGDGTHCGVINGLLRYHELQPNVPLPPYAFIPLGTGNDIAKSLGIVIREPIPSRDLRRSVAAIAHGADYRMDLGRVGGTYFANAMTVGLDSRILRERNVRKRRIERLPVIRSLVRGRLLYALSLARPFVRQNRVAAAIGVDGRTWYEGPMVNVVILNTRIYAGDFDFSPLTYADDGLLDVVLFKGHTDYLAKYLLAIRFNPGRIRELSEHLSKVSSHVQARRVRLELSRPELAQCDGEELPETRSLDVEVVPRVLWIRTPVEPV